MSSTHSGTVIELCYLNQELQQRFPISTATVGSAGIDLRACLDNDLTLQPQQTSLINSGCAISIDDPELCGVIVPRSGLGVKHGIILGNTVGIIDSDYTGEIKIAVWNRSDKQFVIEQFMRICQLLIVPICRPQLKIVNKFSISSDRGAGGFGSTGTE